MEIYIIVFNGHMVFIIHVLCWVFACKQHKAVQLTYPDKEFIGRLWRLFIESTGKMVSQAWKNGQEPREAKTAKVTPPMYSLVRTSPVALAFSGLLPPQLLASWLLLKLLRILFNSHCVFVSLSQNSKTWAEVSAQPDLESLSILPWRMKGKGIPPPSTLASVVGVGPTAYYQEAHSQQGISLT